jgi:5-methylcytosine-specific restriction protein A
MPRRDDRSKQAAQYRTWYKTAIWQALRSRQLEIEPLCRLCQAENTIKPATIVDHITPHRGNRKAFFSAPLQSLCKWHHDSVKQSEERLGYSKQIGLDGFPVDPKHVINRRGKLE